jgi:hypothetical protein
MSGRTLLIIGIVLLLVAGGVALYVLLQPSAAVMTDGPGMLYLYSPT